MTQADIVALSVRGCGVIDAIYAAQDVGAPYSTIDTRPFGYEPRDIILADELGFHDVPVGLQVEDLVTEEIVEFYRGTEIVPKGPNEWDIDFMAELIAVPWAPGCRGHKGFITTEDTFHLASGKDFVAPQLIEGHSLAGAWAELRAGRMRANCISFAAPKVGDRALGNYLRQAIDLFIRWANRQDVVPWSPPYLWPLLEYQHPIPADDVDSTGKVKNEIKAWHNVLVYRHLMDQAYEIPQQFLP